ncbi:MAG TPA: histidine kinase [Steroidobacteraceae bacterium]|nr:histidine kinase [Steroidobacteraceae bacterium]
MKRFAQLFGIVVGVWTLVALANSAALYLLNALVEGKEHLSTILRGQFTDCWTWGALTPLVFLISKRFPLNRRPIALSALVHAGCFLALCGLHCLIAEVVRGPLQWVPPHFHGSMFALRFLENFYSDIWMYWPLVCIQALLDSQARTRERDRLAAKLGMELAGARLELLRAQIHPHFLFNTLHSIAALIRIDRAAAEDMVADLAEVLRASFAHPALQETTLRRELELVRCYMRIQSRRFSDRLTVRFHVAGQTLEAAVPVLVLQPLVENAVVHGVSPAERPCTIEISSRRSEDQLVLRVTDDGVGLTGPHARGVGLSNIERRLSALYGGNHSFELARREGGGAVATVRIPYRRLESDVTPAPVYDEDPIFDRG